MFLGHFGLMFAGNGAASRVSLGALFLLVQFVDLLFWVLALLGIEHFRLQPGATRDPVDFYDYPISHSLLGLTVWGLLIGGAYWVLRRDRLAALVLAVCVVSHWVLDVPWAYWIDRHRAIVSANYVS